MAIYTIENGGFLAASTYGNVPLELVVFAAVDVTPASWTVVRELELPVDALIDEAVFTVTASAAGFTEVETIGEVRAATPEYLDEDDGDYAVVVDFGRMVSLTDLRVSPAPRYVLAWTGTEFNLAGNEISTERVMLEFDGPGSADDLLDRISCTLPTVPTGLELAIDGRTVWFERQGSSAGQEPPTGAGAGYRVELTAALADALAAKVAARSGGSGSATSELVSVELRAASPGFLTLDASVAIRRVHQVAFSDGPTRSITVPSEGPIVVELPLPPESSSWAIDSVELVGRASLPDERILPADGPAFSVDGHLALSSERTLLGRVPEQLTGRFAEVTGLRLALRGGDEGGEIGGRLLTGVGDDPASTVPGEPVAGGDLVPVSIDPGSDVGWVTLATSEPVPAGPLWVELLLSYGGLEWELTDAAVTDPEAPGTALYHRRVGGPLQPLTVLPEVGELFGSLRVIGLPDPNRPVDALRLAIIGDDVGDDGGALPFTPSRDGTTARIGVTSAVQPGDEGIEVGGVASVAGDYTFESIQVTYTEGTS